ncbi:MAG: hypothetical protein ACLFUB_05110 [Cyclobacteriaceae bacterium]
MLTIKDFNLLALKYKEQYTIERGTLIMRRKTSQHIVGLFQLHNFFAEVWYDVIFCRICEVVTHEEKEMFEHYPDFISLDSLY